jgi:hypothetical protein
LAATARVRLFLKEMCQSFQDDVLESHGDHVPKRVRDGAAVLFWLPEILVRAHDNPRSVELWKLAYTCMPVVLARLVNQLSVYDWPSIEDVMV